MSNVNIRLYLVFVFRKGQYESKYGLKSDSMKAAKKKKKKILQISEYFSTCQTRSSDF